MLALVMWNVAKKSDLAREFLNAFGHLESFEFLIYILPLSLGFLNVYVSMRKNDLGFVCVCDCLCDSLCVCSV